MYNIYCIGIIINSLLDWYAKKKKTIVTRRTWKKKAQKIIENSIVKFSFLNLIFLIYIFLEQNDSSLEMRSKCLLNIYQKKKSYIFFIEYFQ